MQLNGLGNDSHHTAKLMGHHNSSFTESQYGHTFEDASKQEKARSVINCGIEKGLTSPFFLCLISARSPHDQYIRPSFKAFNLPCLMNLYIRFREVGVNSPNNSTAASSMVSKGSFIARSNHAFNRAKESLARLGLSQVSFTFAFVCVGLVRPFFWCGWLSFA